MKIKGEEGASALKSVLVLLVIVILLYLVLKFLPVKIDTYAFEDEMRELAKYQGFKKQSEAVIKDKLVKKAAELDLPIKAGQIQVSRRSGDLILSADYTVDVHLGGVYVYNWNFHQQVSVPDLAKIK